MANCPSENYCPRCLEEIKSLPCKHCSYPGEEIELPALIHRASITASLHNVIEIHVNGVMIWRGRGREEEEFWSHLWHRITEAM